MSANKKSSKLNESHLADNSNNDRINNSLSKLRRLKIQENLIFKSIKTSLSQDDLADEQFLNNVFSQSASKKSLKIHNSFIEIRNLFQEVMTNSNNEDADIDEIKKDITALEIQIKTQKTCLESELSVLRNSEKELYQQLQSDPVETVKFDKIKNKVKTFDDIVPSPVKKIMNSPLKSSEIQEYQDYLMTHKRYGGWVEYHHNIFQRLWRKHLEFIDENIDKTELFKSAHFEKFVEDLLRNIQDITINTIIEHSDWYLTFLNLKNRQQCALNEWKKRKNILKQSHHKLNREKPTISENFGRTKIKENKKYLTNLKEESCITPFTPDYCQSSTISSGSSKESLTISIERSFNFNSERTNEKGQNSDNGYLRPTKQWISKCSTLDDDHKWNQNGTGDLKAFGKLRVPAWRSALNN